MKNKIIKIVSMFMVIVMLFGMMTGCDNAKDDAVYDNYSYGLTEDGLYENLENYSLELPDWSSLCFSYEEILQWGVEYIIESGTSDIETIDDYVYRYGEELLSALGLADKEIAEEGDIVSVSLEFYIDEELLSDYSSTRNYEASINGDSIVSSLIGHKADDVYEVNYIFPENDEYYPSQKANVKVTIHSVSIPNPIESGIVEANLDVLNEHLKDVADVDTYLNALRPKLAESTIDSFMESYLQEIEGIEVPEKYIEYEFYRLKFRLNQMGYSYDAYLNDAEMTDEDVREYCALVARENFIAMNVYNSIDDKITEEHINQYYGENVEYIESVQGMPYMKLKLIRDLVITYISDQVVLNETGELPELAVDNTSDVIDVAEPIEESESLPEDTTIENNKIESTTDSE